MIANETVKLSLAKYHRVWTESLLPEWPADETADVDSAPPVASSVVPFPCKRNNRRQAVVALLIMKYRLEECQQYVDTWRDDDVIAELMTMSHWLTEKVLVAYLRGGHEYPTLDVIEKIMAELEDTGVLGPDCDTI